MQRFALTFDGATKEMRWTLLPKGPPIPLATLRRPRGDSD
jgi:hypothetical protein